MINKKYKDAVIINIKKYL